MTRTLHAVPAVALALLLVVAGCAGPVPSPETSTTPTGQPTSTAPTTLPAGEGTVVTVVDVADGDTVDIRYRNGTRDTVRLLGVDTPEVWTKNDPTEFRGVPDTEAGRQCLREWGRAASDYTKSRLAGEQVRIVVGGDVRGSYGRLLAHVYVNGTNHNLRLVEQGYARVYRSEFALLDRFLAAQERARNATRGLWQCATPVPDEAGLVVETVHADAAGSESENLNDEYVVFRNAGNETLELGGWTVADAAGHRYRFPAGTTLAPDARLTLHTGSGTNTETDVYWGAGDPVWNNAGDTVTVYNASGTSVLHYEYD
ncbi:lamin tail domain-containing protein [Halospeciosus flavus]|uniref:Lamin tail domain-containing protein n=1 Tax=Halospeciosus flavus TaxID=3032283 RepID=A0ABD5Z2D4_9EURY|nr:lamin tail domain-containing protein [Halospeciosus flavus]